MAWVFSAAVSSDITKRISAMRQRLSFWGWSAVFASSVCVTLFGVVEREIGRLDAHVDTIIALDCYVCACNFTPNDQALKYLSYWLDQEERFVNECFFAPSIGHYGRLRKLGKEKARHARDRLRTMGRIMND